MTPGPGSAKAHGELYIGNFIKTYRLACGLASTCTLHQLKTFLLAVIGESMCKLCVNACV
jgi:hypothetical protein